MEERIAIVVTEPTRQYLVEILRRALDSGLIVGEELSIASSLWQSVTYPVAITSEVKEENQV